MLYEVITLSQNTVYQILQDKNGFMWVGTKDGLSASDATAYLRDLRGMISRLSEKFDVRVMTS